MENKINLVEILKNCPKGMELDCTIFNSVTFGGIDSGSNYPIEIKIGDKNTVTEWLTEFGEWNTNENSKCVIFPKGKTTWKGFIPSCKFKDGDIVVSREGDYIFMLKKANFYPGDDVYKVYNGTCYFGLANAKFLLTKEAKWYFNRLATEEEKQKLFQAVKDNGYRWNNETKSLEKLLEPKFKMGNTVKNKDNHTIVIVRVTDEYYTYIDQKGERGILYIRAQNDWELVSDNLIPFESKVLVRDTNQDLWKPAIYGFLHNKWHYVVGGLGWEQCIPYEGNEHLLGTSNDCSEFYKTWK